MNAPIKLALLVSGGGTTAKSIVDETKPGGKLHGKVEPVCVIASKPDCGAVEKLGPKGLGLPIEIVDRKGKPSDQFNKELIAALHKYPTVNFVGQYGWLPTISASVLDEFKDRIKTWINQHPGPLNKNKFDFGGKGMYGALVHAARLLFAKRTGKNLWTEAVAHRVTKEVDGGDVVHKVRIPITDDMLDFNPNELDDKFKEKVKALQARVLPYEHQVQKDVLEDAANEMISDAKPARVLNEKLPWQGDSRLNEIKKTIADAKLAF